SVEPDGILLSHSDARTAAIVVVVFERRHEGESVGRAAQKDHHERLCLVAVSIEGRDRVRHINASEILAKPAGEPSHRRSRGNSRPRLLADGGPTDGPSSHP